ncbi:hypothetical protein SVAN01_11059 [Stagonosporopsis vannaccii]|nr:hypothetical protein SVAN01_11059 [Stagonosporopsis vannaccii]
MSTAMQLSISTFAFAFLGLAASSGYAPKGESDLSSFGAPRHNLDGVLPVLDIEEYFIRSQTDGGAKAFGGTDLRCSASTPCPDGSCCNSRGECGYRDEHCKESCVANCDAKAPCGVNSEDGQRTCPLNVCCSHFGFCGANEAFCRDTTDSGLSTPCQKNFGKCGTVRKQATPVCGKNSGTASRRVAYYEGWNTRRRSCDKVWPADIDSTGLTHLIFSFATIDPTTFAIIPMQPDDEKLYIDFLALKDGSQKWIGIGGWEFSDAGATRHTWSNMASSKNNRNAFLVSLLKFLDRWDFAGVDIDWEWPGAETRGGNSTIDKQNHVDLMKELREALGPRGLGVVMPAQYEYLKHLDPKALESSVDFFNVLAYDLHGPWDAAIPGLGPLIKPHTDLEEIDTALDLFWFNDVNPSKINLGVANYGRGYTLANSECAQYGCTWIGPSKARECTELVGVLSQCEIQRIINQNQLKPKLISKSAGVKQIVFDGEWVGYDDNETLGLKTELANNRCLGGTALWAVDYASCGGGGGGHSAPQSSAVAPSPSSSDVSDAPSASVLLPSASSVFVQPPVPVISSTLIAPMPEPSVSATSTVLVFFSTSSSSMSDEPISTTSTEVELSSTLAPSTSGPWTSVTSAESDLSSLPGSSAAEQSTSMTSVELVASSIPQLTTSIASSASKPGSFVPEQPNKTSSAEIEVSSTFASFTSEDPTPALSTERATSSWPRSSISTLHSTKLAPNESASMSWSSEVSAWTSMQSSRAVISSFDLIPSVSSRAESTGSATSSTLVLSVSRSTEESVKSSTLPNPKHSSQDLSFAPSTVFLGTSQIDSSGAATSSASVSPQSSRDESPVLDNTNSDTSKVKSTRALTSMNSILSFVGPSVSTSKVQTTLSTLLASFASTTSPQSPTTFPASSSAQSSKDKVSVSSFTVELPSKAESSRGLSFVVPSLSPIDTSLIGSATALSSLSTSPAVASSETDSSAAWSSEAWSSRFTIVSSFSLPTTSIIFGATEPSKISLTSVSAQPSSETLIATSYPPKPTGVLPVPPMVTVSSFTIPSPASPSVTMPDTMPFPSRFTMPDLTEPSRPGFTMSQFSKSPPPGFSPPHYTLWSPPPGLTLPSGFTLPPVFTPPSGLTMPQPIETFPPGFTLPPRFTLPPPPEFTAPSPSESTPPHLPEATLNPPGLTIPPPQFTVSSSPEFSINPTSSSSDLPPVVIVPSLTTLLPPAVTGSNNSDISSAPISFSRSSSQLIGSASSFLSSNWSAWISSYSPASISSNSPAWITSNSSGWMISASSERSPSMPASSANEITGPAQTLVSSQSRDPEGSNTKGDDLPNKTTPSKPDPPKKTTLPDDDPSNDDDPTDTEDPNHHKPKQKDCVPNDCKKECAGWYALTLVVFKRPACPCRPKTCRDDEDTDSDSDGDENCGLFGCGCGWMGLPFGGFDCKTEFPFPKVFPSGLFGPKPCQFFGSCPPNNNRPPEPCGPFGCDGYCDGEKGCDPCPSDICGGPQCPIATGCGPRPGPNPSPNPMRPKKCKKEQETKVTEKLVICTENIKLEPTTIASINFTVSTTLTSVCLTPVLYTRTGCGLLGTTQTTTLSSTTLSSTSAAPICTRAPLDLNNDEGDNEQPPRTNTTTAIEGPTCSRAPLILDDDEGDNEHPTPTGGQYCTRAPLSLDDDEGDNEHPMPTEGSFCSRAPLSLDDDEGDNSQPTSAKTPACTRAPLSLDDDEGNNDIPSGILSRLFSSMFSNSTMFPSTPTPTPISSWWSNSTMISSTPTLMSNSLNWSLVSTRLSTSMPTSPSIKSTSRPLPPSTLSVSMTSPWGTSIPSGTPSPNCSTCDTIFSTCIKESCKRDGSDAVQCSKFCLSDLCYGLHSADYCKRGSCRPAACPKQNPTDFFRGEPALPFTTVLSLPGTRLTVTASPTYSTVSISHSPTPTCDPGHTIAPDGKWTALVEQEIRSNPNNATISWTLWDEHGCKAGDGAAWDPYAGHNISTHIGSPERTPDYGMGYVLHTNVTQSLSASLSEIEFSISTPVDACREKCWVKWKVNSRDESRPWQITEDCAQQCGSPKLQLTNVNCDDDMNKWHDPGDWSIRKRGGYCTWHMPFKYVKDDPSPSPLSSWTRSGRWTLEVVQWMEYEESFLEYWLSSPNGTLVKHIHWDTSKENDGATKLIETTDRDAPSNFQMRYGMVITLHGLRKKDDSTLKITYMNKGRCGKCMDFKFCPLSLPQCQPSYQTETNDEKQQSLLDDCSITNGLTRQDHLTCLGSLFQDNAEFSCDKVADAYFQKGAGFERRFKCWWPDDFVDPYGNQDRARSEGTDGTNGASGFEGIDAWRNGSWTNVTWR